MAELAYDDRGVGDAVLFIAGRGSLGRTWDPHQAPAFLASGYRVITFDNRGVGATENASEFTVDTMVADTAALIEELDAAPVRVVGASMGAYIAQELILKRPELVSQGVLMAAAGRYDYTREFLVAAEHERVAWDPAPPPEVDAGVRLLQAVSRKTLTDETAATEWIDMFVKAPTKLTPGLDCQIDIYPKSDRLHAYRAITTPVLVIGFADDLLCPPHLGAEVANVLPNGRYLQIADAGHLGFLERPDVVNAAILSFFAGRD